MNPSLKFFLEAEDLDDLLAEDDLAAIRSIIQQWKDPHAVSNLLLHPTLIPEDIGLVSIQRGLDEREEYYYVLASIVGLQSIDRENLLEQQRLAVLERLLFIIESDDGVFSARATVSMRGFLRENDGASIFRYTEHPNEAASHNALVWLIEVIGSKGADQLATVGEASGVSPETLEYVLGKFKEHILEMESLGFSKLVMPLYEAIPNLADVQRPA